MSKETIILLQQIGILEIAVAVIVLAFSTLSLFLYCTRLERRINAMEEALQRNKQEK